MEKTDTPDRRNINMSVIKVNQNKDPNVIFSWIFEELEKEKEKFQRHILFCNTMKDCSLIYNTLVKNYGKSHLFNMFHSDTTNYAKD